MTRRLADKVAVVTGAARGIGRAIALRFTDEGAHVVLADRDEDAGAHTAAEAAGLFIPTDVTDPQAVERLYTLTTRNYGRLDIAVNNAGICRADDGDILETTLAAWDATLEVNLRSMFLCCRFALMHMRPRGSGNIINMSSAVALTGTPAAPVAYTAGKGALVALTRQMAARYAGEGIRVNALCPGPVDTALLDDLFATDPRRAVDRLIVTPMRGATTPDDIAAAAAFLASDDAARITGTALPVDGGLTTTHVTGLPGPHPAPAPHR
ncbi:glucose 1-dehydrogenase [Streptomyces sp. LP05-1]|uniref:Glucose 1-dehydrogenase n=1 Tax=Streptomyces pyxinae TaxID=2970734 RepID=A0ABT2CBP6_9ACTN|nr:glucose 1-dehydrogenase [Streptomyces sp. LP05-1]MCS0634740.1 glucose 1-dehydrogenase [Streptomyces sp. LP05-1]